VLLAVEFTVLHVIAAGVAAFLSFAFSEDAIVGSLCDTILRGLEFPVWLVSRGLELSDESRHFALLVNSVLWGVAATLVVQWYVARSDRRRETQSG